MNKDVFNATGGAPGKSSPTQRLVSGATSSSPRASLGVSDPELRSKIELLITRLEPRIELLMQACLAAKLKMPGVEMRPATSAPRPNAAQVVAQLAETLQANPRLAQAVQVTIFRFQQVLQSMADKEASSSVEQLRRNVFFLTNLPDELKGDRILAVLFPPTPERVGTARVAGGGSDAEREQLKRREDALGKAQALQQALEPRMVIAKMALQAVEKGFATNLSAMLNPQGRQARLIAIALTGDTTTVAKLHVAHGQFEELKSTLPRVRAGMAELDVLRPIVLPLGELGTTFHLPVLLRDLFTRPLAGPLAPPAPTG